MDATRFDRLTRTLSSGLSRRGLAVALGLGAISLPALADARQQHKNKKRKKLEKNAFGCVNVGKACRGEDAVCCSGICHGKRPRRGERDKSRCAGHDASTCLAGQDTCGGESVPCDNGSSEFARCVITTGNAPYCAGDVFCRTCARDADCPADEFEAGAVCIVCQTCLENTACATLRTFA